MYGKNIETLKKENMNLADKIYIFDTTLRDGEQAPGVALTVDEKIQIAQKLDKLGVDKIEAGFPVSSNGERKAAKELNSLGLNATVLGLARSVQKDIDAVLDSGLDYIHTFIGTSPLHRDYKLKMSKEKVIETAVESVEYAKDHGLTVEFSAEDATRTEHDYLFDVYDAVVDAGADFLNVPDTVGVLIPVITKELITNLKERYTTPISVHFHNDFGLATANTLTAIECGADQAHVTVNGMGERTGNASLEELIVALHAAYNIDLNIDTTQLYSLSEFVGRITGIKMPVNKPIVGANAFAHESGIHVHGVLNNALTYEPISPELVGHSRRIVLGKHTGANAVKAKLEKYNIDLTEEQFQNVFDGDPYTSMDYREPSGGWVGLDSGHPVQIQKITFSPRNRDNFIRKGDLYELFYAQTNGWESLGKQTATSDSLSYNAPEGALLYLRNHSRGNDERIFEMVDGKQRLW